MQEGDQDGLCGDQDVKVQQEDPDRPIPGGSSVRAVHEGERCVLLSLHGHVLQVLLHELLAGTLHYLYYIN